MALGKFEGGDLSQGFMRMGDKAELLSRSALEQSSNLALSFEAPLKVPSLLMFAWASDPTRDFLLPFVGAPEVLFRPLSTAASLSLFNSHDLLSSAACASPFYADADAAAAVQEFVRMTKSAKATMADRGLALASPAHRPQRGRPQTLQAAQAARHPRHPGAHGLGFSV